MSSPTTREPQYTPPKRRFRVIHGKQRLTTDLSTRRVTRTPDEEIIERENIRFYDSFVVFSDGGEYQVQVNIVAVSWESGMRIEEVMGDA
jgi:hypothetical protein